MTDTPAPANADATDALVIFTPSGKRGRVAVGTPVLAAARQLGVDLDSVCGGRGICSKCQVSPGVGAFPKHGLTVTAEGGENCMVSNPLARATTDIRSRASRPTTSCRRPLTVSGPRRPA